MALNAEQQQAVDCDDHLLVLAPPGSGKTGTLVAKTKRILDIDPRNVVLLVTFTDASAKEAKERIKKAVGAARMRNVLVSTFHSHAIAQLRASNRLGRILTPSESTTLVKQALNQTGTPGDLFETEAHIQLAKSQPGFSGKEDEIIAAYEQLKRSHRAIDLQDVIRECVNGMRASNPDLSVAPLPCTHVLCDEFQDVDMNQLNWLLCYRDAGAIVTAVGDDDQAIYGWRSSLGYKAVELYVEATKPQIINLEINYRSNSEILSHADTLIRRNALRMPKRLISAKGDGGGVSKEYFADKDGEAERVVELVIEDVIEEGGSLSVPPGRWGIIARNNRDLWMIAGKLRQAGIPVKASKRDPAPNEVMGFCALLTSICTSETLGLRRALDDAGVSGSSSNAIQKALGDNFCNLMDGEIPEVELPVEDKQVVVELARMCKKWRSMLASDSPAYSRVIAGAGAWYADAIKMSEDARSDFNVFAESLASGRGSIMTRINSFFRQPEPKGEAGVTILTMHGSKGLEFDRVFVAQCNVGTIPSSKTHSVEEERRLFYVAMTRAREDLHLSWISTKGASVFLSEI